WTSPSLACSSYVGASYPVFVHRLALLLRASFGPTVAGTPLRFANPSPPSGWVEHLHAQHTKTSLPEGRLAGMTARPHVDPTSAVHAFQKYFLQHGMRRRWRMQ